MARKNVHVTTSLSKKEVDHLLSHYNLDVVFEAMIKNPKVEELYAEVRKFEKKEFPKTMRARIKNKYKTSFKDFKTFQKLFGDFLKRVIISEFLDNTTSYPFCSGKKAAKRVAKHQDEILQWTISYVYIDLMSDISFAFINRGFQPLKFQPLNQ